MAEDSNVWGVLYGRRWSSPFPSHAAIPRSASFYDMDVDDYSARPRPSLWHGEKAESRRPNAGARAQIRGSAS
jgi:hypothetical protein